MSETKAYYLQALSAAFENRYTQETNCAKTEELAAILHHLKEALRLDGRSEHHRLFLHHCKALQALIIHHLEAEVYEALNHALK